MPRVELTADLSAYIRERIERFADEASPKEVQFHALHIKAHGALPLYSAWTATAGIRPDGELVSWVTEDWTEGVDEFADPSWVNLALVQGARRYPPLKDAIPARPEGATSCDGCGGAGVIPDLPENLKNVICRCGGIGWLPPRARCE